MAAHLEDTPDQHDWTFGDHAITQFCVDRDACRIQSWSLSDSLDIRLEVPFRLSLADGTTREIDPELPEQLAPLLTVVGREIVRLIVSRGGSLQMGLSDGSVIEVQPHPRHEAFEIAGGGSLEGVSYRARPGAGAPWDP